jgi:hypothetical protein
LGNAKLNNAKACSKIDQDLEQVTELMQKMGTITGEESQRAFCAEVEAISDVEPKIENYQLVGEKISSMMLGFLTSAEHSDNPSKPGTWNFELNPNEYIPYP